MDEKKADEIRSYLEQKFLSRTRDEWFDILSRDDIPVSKAYTLDEIAEDPQLQHRRMIVEVDHPEEGRIRQTGISIKLSETPGTIRNLGARPGESTGEILSELGYNQEEIKKFTEERIIGQSD